MYRYISHIYTLSVIVAFGLLFFANADNIESLENYNLNLGVGKLFYFPCASALISSFFLHPRKRDVIDWCIKIMIVIAIITTLIMPKSSLSLLNQPITRFVLGILCFQGLRDIPKSLIVRYLAYLSPIIILLHFTIINPFSFGIVRFAGFYGDPNYLALALNLIITNSYIYIINHNNVKFNIVLILTIIGAIILIILGVSRGGIIATSINILFILYSVFRRNKFIGIVIIASILVGAGFIMGLLSTQVQNVVNRFSVGNESLESGSDSRISQLYGGFNILRFHPEYALLGIGIGNSNPAVHDYRYAGYVTDTRIHNTFISILVEQGVISFVLYFIMYIYQGHLLIKKRRYISLGLMIGTLLSINTIYVLCFMPYWIITFYIANNNCVAEK